MLLHRTVKTFFGETLAENKASPLAFSLGSPDRKPGEHVHGD